jgi:RHS repeat-associated protein
MAFKRYKCNFLPPLPPIPNQHTQHLVDLISEKYCFDALNRLTSSITGMKGTVPPSCTASGPYFIGKSIGYNSLGNIVSKSDVGAYTYPAVGHAQPHAVTSISGTVNGVVNPVFSYDQNGNLTSGAGRAITYTSYNMTSTISEGALSLTFTYDSEHQRITQSSSGAVTTYLVDPVSGAKSEVYTYGSVTTKRDYVGVPAGESGTGGLLVERIGTSGAAAVWGLPTNWFAFNWGAPAATSYVAVDALGSVAAITASNGSVSERDSFDAWGRRRNPNGSDNAACAVTSSTTRGFTNQEMLDNVCFINMNARVYDQTLGRFLAPDPVTQDIYDPQKLNRFSYVNNRPLDAVDPTGEYVCGGGPCPPVVVVAIADLGLAQRYADDPASAARIGQERQLLGNENSGGDPHHPVTIQVTATTGQTGTSGTTGIESSTGAITMNISGAIVDTASREPAFWRVILVRVFGHESSHAVTESETGHNPQTAAEEQGEEKLAVHTEDAVARGLYRSGVPEGESVQGTPPSSATKEEMGSTEDKRARESTKLWCQGGNRGEGPDAQPAPSGCD